MYIYIYICIYIYIHIYIYTHIYIYIHQYLLTFSLPNTSTTCITTFIYINVFPSEHNHNSFPHKFWAFIIQRPSDSTVLETHHICPFTRHALTFFFPPKKTPRFSHNIGNSLQCPSGSTALEKYISCLTTPIFSPTAQTPASQTCP